MTHEVIDVELSKITVNPFQPRRQFPQVELEELAQSIQSVGLIHPPVVRSINGGELYEIISGERRFRAAQIAGLRTMPLMVREVGDVFSAEASLIENIQRVDLNAIEISRALKALMEDFGHSQEDLARRVGKKRSTVANYLRLLSLPKGIQDSLLSGEISMGHAKAILSLEGFEKQLMLHERILKEEMSVREAEEAAIRGEFKKEKKERIAPVGDCFMQDLQEKIQQRLGTKVTVEGKGKQGRISIEYYDLDDLDRLLDILGVI
jgi:ParB family chromosome partitioning protein